MLIFCLISLSGEVLFSFPYFLSLFAIYLAISPTCLLIFLVSYELDFVILVADFNFLLFM